MGNDAGCEEIVTPVESEINEAGSSGGTIPPT